MALKLLLDVGVSKKAEEQLSKKYDLRAVRDIDPRLPDHKILEMAVSEKRMVVTMDKDFGELVYRSGLQHHGVLILRMEESDGNEKTEVLSQLFEHYGERMSGHFCVYQDGRLRIRTHDAVL